MYDYIKGEVIETGNCKKTLTVGYLIKQLKAYPVKGFLLIARALDALAPGFIKSRLVTLPSGEIFMLAKKPSSS